MKIIKWFLIFNIYLIFSLLISSSAFSNNLRIPSEIQFKLNNSQYNNYLRKSMRAYTDGELYGKKNIKKKYKKWIKAKILVDGKFFFTVDIVRNGLSIDVLSRQEIERSSNIKNKIRKKPETNIFLDKINESSSQLEKHRTGKARKLNDIIREAEIYKVTFTIENKTFVYVGQDSYCSGKHYYFGSSILTDFCKLVYGDKIFEKTILQSFQNIKQKNLNIKEWESIYNARSECKKNGWHNINREVQK